MEYPAVRGGGSMIDPLVKLDFWTTLQGGTHG